MSGRKFHKDHSWILAEGDQGTIGVSDYAQNQLGKIIYVELPEEGREVGQGEPLGVIESNKATSDLIAPVSGEVIESNSALDENPERINDSPYGQGWITIVKLSNPAELEGLMDEEAYLKMVGVQA
jgi:glycine cleavage system H protein